MAFFGVFVIPRDIHGEPENLRFIAVHQLFESTRITALGGGHQEVFVVPRNS